MWENHRNQRGSVGLSPDLMPGVTNRLKAKWPYGHTTWWQLLAGFHSSPSLIPVVLTLDGDAAAPQRAPAKVRQAPSRPPTPRWLPTVDRGP